MNRLVLGFILAAGVAWPQIPTISGVVNAASFVPGPVAPGTFVGVFGNNLAPQTSVASSLPLPTSLAGTSATLAGRPLPLFFVSSGQINAQIPFDIANGASPLVIRTATGTSATFQVTIAPSSPGLFTTTADGRGAAISVHPDFRLVERLTGKNAFTGETIVLFCTGLGAVTGSPVAGAAGPTSPLSYTLGTTTVTMGGRPANVSFAGLAPGFAGLYQINVTVPEGVGGDVAIVVTVGSASSNVATVNVRGAYALAANYAGTLTAKNGDRYGIGVADFSQTNQFAFLGSYALAAGTLIVDRGSFLLQSTSDTFQVSGRSTVDGAPFVGILDTLDAGESFFGLLYANDSLDKVRDPNSWYASFVFSRVVPAAPAIPPVLTGIASNCAAVEGAQIFSGNVYLGRVTSNTFAADSIGNRFGAYGSPYSVTSIFNQFGAYGSAFSLTSAFNQLATNPPVIVKGTGFAYLTINPLKTPGIDPRSLYSCIGR